MRCKVVPELYVRGILFYEMQPFNIMDLFSSDSTYTVQSTS